MLKFNREHTDNTVQKKCTLTLLHHKQLKCFHFHVFAKGKRQSSEFGTLDFIGLTKSYRQSVGTLTSVFRSCTIRVVPCLGRYCFNGNAFTTQNSGDLTVAATHAHLKSLSDLLAGIHWHGDKKQKKQSDTCGCNRLLANATTTTTN